MIGPICPQISCPLISRPVTTGFNKLESFILACLYLIFKRMSTLTSDLMVTLPPPLLTTDSESFMYFNLDLVFF